MTDTGDKSPFEGQSILITGGAGFLGRGILRHLEREKINASVTIYSRDEHKHTAIRARWPYVHTVLGDVRDTDRLSMAMTGRTMVIHAAAMKHIPEGELNANECVSVNVDGSSSVAVAAIRARVRHVVGISTDKAVEPLNTYGASKMLMERMFQEANRLSSTRFVSVRYGNVVSSTGSVVPIFRKAIEEGRPIPITSQHMTRFWLSVQDAVHLIERAVSSTGWAGNTYVAQCKSMTITDVGHAVSDYYGVEGSGRPSFSIIGLRPGEKMHEALIGSNEGPYTTINDGLYVIPPATSFTGDRVGAIQAYVSDNPVAWMDSVEFMRCIREAEELA